MTAGVFDLCAMQIAAALSNEALSAIDGLDGMTAVSLDASFAYGTGGTSVVAVVQTTLDGTNWRDIARFDFGTAASVKHANLSGLLSKGITSTATLSSEGVVDGLLGNKLRVVLNSSGTFVNTTLSIRAAVR
jgi:hypothetical protein